MSEVATQEVPQEAASEEAKKPTPIAEVVQLEDGTSVEFTGKKRMIKESFFPESGLPYVKFSFRNGKVFVFQIQERLLHRLAAHGAEQKLGDETAGTTDVDDMYVDVEALGNRLNDSEKTADEAWKQTREPGQGFAGISILISALVEHSGKDVEAVKAFLKDKDQKTKTALKNSETLRPIVERLEKEKAAKGPKIDTDALLAAL